MQGVQMDNLRVFRHFRTQSMQVKSGRSPLETKPPIVMQREHVLYK